jgi:hypothetical protein
MSEQPEQTEEDIPEFLPPGAAGATWFTAGPEWMSCVPDWMTAGPDAENS